jgi:hypothetical protein
MPQAARLARPEISEVRILGLPFRARLRLQIAQLL